MKHIIRAVVIVLFLVAVGSLRSATDPICDQSHIVLIRKIGSPEEKASFAKLEKDLSSFFKVFDYDFSGDDTLAIAKVDDAALVVIGSSPGDWPEALVTALNSYLDHAGSLLFLDMNLHGKSPSFVGLWNRLKRIQGCGSEPPARESLFESAQPQGDHVVARNVNSAALDRLSPDGTPRHMLAFIAKDERGRALAWMTAYAAASPVRRLGNVAVIPLDSTESLSSPEVRRLVFQAALAATDNEDLIPANGMKVTP